LDDKETMIDPQNANPRGVRDGEEIDPLDLIIKGFNEKWFQGWNATPEEQRVKFVSIAKFVRQHPNFSTHYLNNTDVQNRDLALMRMISDTISKQRISELELYKLYINDGAFKIALEDSIRRMVEVW
jgi:type I restriction enzyme, R subunit